jgi:5-histidylcysteine sulfoxide synthase/putative 4-mercaptohistidine N1-methyltranferase
LKTDLINYYDKISYNDYNKNKGDCLNRLSLYPPTLDAKSIVRKRSEIKEYFLNTFAIYEKVFELLKDESVFYKQSEPTRHPMIFYYGHTATFFINKLINMKIIEQRINPEFESIFAVGVDEMQWDDMESSHYKWPALSAVKNYREQVKHLVLELIDTLEFTLPIDDKSAMWIILMGIEHERIHIETSLVLHRQMPLEYIKEVQDFPLCQNHSSLNENVMVDIPAQEVKLGKSKEHNLYGWDNEYGEYSEYVEDFQVGKYLVSNAEYLEFVKEGGYKKEEYWSKEGLDFLAKTNATHPPFWREKKDGTYAYRALYKEIELPLSWPAEVNALEASAFCKYKSQKENSSYSLPSESEYMAMYKYAKLKDIVELAHIDANLNFEYYTSSCPVDEFEFHGICDVVGNVWQWSRTPIDAFKGFEVHEAYDDFSTPTFDKKHALILGSSWASSGNLIMKHSRYAFRRHFYQNAGFRYVITQEKISTTDESYESDALVSQYCEFQYGDTHFGVKNFAIECAKIASTFSLNKTKALDLGCATGRASFELAKEFDKVEGVDFSARFIQVGVRLQEQGAIAFSSKQEGEIQTIKKVSMKELGYESLKNKVSFWQGDACNLKPHLNSYDLIMATNLIDRLYSPHLFLDSIDTRLNKDGILMITSPYTWQEESTKKEFWLGGYYKNNKEIRTIDTLKNILLKKFELVHIQDLEFVIKETQRKYQHTVSELSVWRKK